MALIPLLGFRTVSKTSLQRKRNTENPNQDPCVMIKRKRERRDGNSYYLSHEFALFLMRIYRRCSLTSVLHGIHTDERAQKGSMCVLAPSRTLLDAIGKISMLVFCVLRFAVFHCSLMWQHMSYWRGLPYVLFILTGQCSCEYWS